MPKPTRCVQSWTENEVHGSAGVEGMQNLQPHDTDDTVSANESHSDDDFDMHDHSDRIFHTLCWSMDGCRLAVASSASLTRQARCSVLCFI